LKLERIQLKKKPFLFISCGQYTPSEKQLGMRIAALVTSTTTYDAFFAEDQHDLNGLDQNILSALRDCSGLIAILHPRGRITRPDGGEITRASVWIEQEIAIATYIQRVEKREIPVVAFIQNQIGLEGLRQLIHLNPIQFDTDSEVVERLPGILRKWTPTAVGSFALEIHSARVGRRDEHMIRELEIFVTNNTNQRINTYDMELTLPGSVLRHWSTSYMGELASGDPLIRRFRFNEKGRETLAPRSKVRIFRCEYCLFCGRAYEGEKVLDSQVVCTLWAADREVRLENPIRIMIEGSGDQITDLISH
jgi:hypothetical protein